MKTSFRKYEEQITTPKNGGKNIKEDLQDKINTYQNILRKTYGRTTLGQKNNESTDENDSVKTPYHRSFANLTYDDRDKTWQKPPTNLP